MDIGGILCGGFALPAVPQAKVGQAGYGKLQGWVCMAMVADLNSPGRRRYGGNIQSHGGVAHRDSVAGRRMGCASLSYQCAHLANRQRALVPTNTCYSSSITVPAI